MKTPSGLVFRNHQSTRDFRLQSFFQSFSLSREFLPPGSSPGTSGGDVCRSPFLWIVTSWLRVFLWILCRTDRPPRTRELTSREVSYVRTDTTWSRPHLFRERGTVHLGKSNGCHSGILSVIQKLDFDLSRVPSRCTELRTQYVTRVLHRRRKGLDGINDYKNT